MLDLTERLIKKEMILILLTILFLTCNGSAAPPSSADNTSSIIPDLANFWNSSTNTSVLSWIFNKTNLTHLIPEYHTPNPVWFGLIPDNLVPYFLKHQARLFVNDQQVGRFGILNRNATFFTIHDFQTLRLIHLSNITNMTAKFREFAQDNLESVQLLENFNQIIEQGFKNFNDTLKELAFFTKTMPNVTVMEYPAEFMNKFRILCYIQETHIFEKNSNHAIKTENLLYIQMLMKFAPKESNIKDQLTNEFKNIGEKAYIRQQLIEAVKQLDENPDKFPSIYCLPYTQFWAKVVEDRLLERINKLGLIHFEEAKRFLDYLQLEKYAFNYNNTKNSSYIETEDLIRLHTLLTSNYSDEFKSMLKNLVKNDIEFSELIDMIKLSPFQVPLAFNKYLVTKEAITNFHSIYKNFSLYQRNEELKGKNLGLFTLTDLATLKILHNKISDELNEYAQKKLSASGHRDDFSNLMKKFRNSSQVIEAPQPYPIGFINGIRSIYYKYLFKQNKVSIAFIPTDFNNLRLCFKYGNASEFSSQLLSHSMVLENVNLRNEFADMLIQLQLYSDVLPASHVLPNVSYPISFINETRIMYYSRIIPEMAKKSNETHSFFQISDLTKMRDLMLSSANSTNKFVNELRDFGIEYLQSRFYPVSLVENYLDMVNELNVTPVSVIPAVSIQIYPIEFIDEIRNLYH